MNIGIISDIHGNFEALKVQITQDVCNVKEFFHHRDAEAQR